MKRGPSGILSAFLLLLAVSSFGSDGVISESKQKATKKKTPASLEWGYSKPARLYFTKSEVTVAQYRSCVKAGKCKVPISKSDDKHRNWNFKERDNHPVNCIDLKRAIVFCSWVGGRLPTEKEWCAEASNGGKRKYPWGDTEVNCEYAVMSQGGVGCGRQLTWPVCSKPAGNSVSGLCDMSGNVMEWAVSSKGTREVFCGGALGTDVTENLRVACRSEEAESLREPHYGGFGIRCVRERGTYWDAAE